ncbi:sulfatase family protein [Thalassoroseus pseudoceratinae]|uniref:sulfatase family protein n=1 Tax=Thalassoroseus pseudoceratinae TaxID=2713176 RepID=UPI00141E8DCD|nr:sulfatase [Thalassoroseus pseudoceratinae]
MNRTFGTKSTLNSGCRLIAIVITTLISWSANSVANDARPNFVIIFTDDQGYQDVGCFGSPDIRTPRLDEMAKQGMRFTSFYAQPICGPSRAALMTGCYPMRVAERGNIKQIHPILHEDEVTIAEVLKSKGYQTACFGKWDLAKHSQTDFHIDLFPTRQGFDYFFGTPTSNDRIANLYRNEELIEKSTPLATLTQRYTDEAIAFMTRNQKQPFFVYLPHTMPHTKLAASAKFKGKSPRGIYGDVIEEIDFNVGRLLDAIDDLGLADNTYVLFTSDNGPWLIKNRKHADGHLKGDHGGSAGPLRSGKVSTFEGGVRVPAILWGPGRVPKGLTCHQLASTLDILPTFANLAGAEIPTDRVIDGEDITHLFHGKFEQANREKTFFYYLRVHLQAVRQGKWKLHLPREKEPVGAAPFSRNTHIAPADRIGFDKPFLVDLENDIGETTNVAAEHPQVVQQLLGLAEEMRSDLGDYDRVGKNMRFFDPLTTKPKTPPLPPDRKRRPRKPSPTKSQHSLLDPYPPK